LSNLQTAGKQLATGQFGKSGYEAVTAGEQLAKATTGADISSTSDAATAVSGPEVEIFDVPAAQGTDASVYDQFGVNRRFASTVDPAKASQTTFDMSTLQQPEGFTETPGLVDSLKDAFTPGGRTFTESMSDVFLPSSATPTATDFMKANPGMPLDIAKQFAADAAKQAPGMLRTFGPAAAVAGLGAAAGGFFSKPEQESLNIDDIRPPIKTGPEYELPGETPTGASGDVRVATDYTSGYLQNPFINPFVRPMLGTQFAADGGEIFPRRTGGIMPNEGTPGKDSVRAMLMPGEFVMTTDAVKGMGDGNNEKGINRMYDMMRNLESRGKAMA